MSGKRAKRLRAEFFSAFGRWPKKSRFSQRCMSTVGVPLGRATQTVETTKLVKRIFRPVKFVQRILRAVFTVDVTSPSEWRRWKKAAGDRQAFEERIEPIVAFPKRGVVLAKRIPAALELTRPLQWPERLAS
jgi:hypothetical protein